MTNTIDYLTKIYSHLQDHNAYKPLTYNSTSAMANDAFSLIQYMYSQHIIDKATRGGSRINFRVLPKFYKKIEHRNGIICRKIIIQEESSR